MSNKRKRKRSRVLRQIKKKEFIASLKQGGCEHCGTMHNLTFHHIGEKTDEVSDMVSRRGCSLTKLQEELSHCIVLCRDCHDQVHKEDKETRGALYRWVNGIRESE